MSSKSLAVDRFNSETLLEKRLMVSLPKVGICLNLQMEVSSYRSNQVQAEAHTGDLIREAMRCLHYPVSGEGAGVKPSRHSTRPHASNQRQIF